jgi:exosome complex component RRP42
MNEIVTMNDDLKAHIIEALNKGIRFDGRKLDELRKMEVKTGIINTSEGSASVKIGETEVLGGIKMSIEKPYPDTPTEGTIMVEAELLPLSSPDFEPGPPDIRSVEMARVVDRGIRESKTIDMKDLCIDKGEKAWSVSIDLLSVNYAGNLIDAFGLAALLALRNARFPEYKEGAVDYHKKTDRKLILKRMPIPVTVFKLGNNFIVDPTVEEEGAVDVRLTVTTTEDGRLCALQKGEEGELSTDDIAKMVELAIAKAKEIRELVR